MELARYRIPTFLGGMAQVLDLTGGSAYLDRAGSPAERDARALAGDWRRVGSNLERVAQRWRSAAGPRPASDGAP
jgi:hypothetical protein